MRTYPQCNRTKAVASELSGTCGSAAKIVGHTTLATSLPRSWRGSWFGAPFCELSVFGIFFLFDVLTVGAAGQHSNGSGCQSSGSSYSNSGQILSS
ncbi:hypothetical protein NQ103_09290, partial [Vibrio parahaemolyticus]|nr:hypothetical protein [Vibrio parahaemolyticus]